RHRSRDAVRRPCRPARPGSENDCARRSPPMMRWIVASSMHLRYLIVVIAAAVMAVGVAQLRTMPVDVLPEFAPPYVEIQAEALGLSAPEVENLVSLNIEELEAGVSWVRTIRSTSVPGMSNVTLIFEPGTDFMRARQLTSER